jgi:hypothetical protein
MKTFSFTTEQLRILQAITSHALENKLEAEEEECVQFVGGSCAVCVCPSAVWAGSFW